MTIAVWQSILEYLKHHDCKLERLVLGDNDICDELLDSLKDAAASNNVLQELEFNCNQGVTAAGWVAFLIAVLPNTNSSLEKLCIRGNKDRGCAQEFPATQKKTKKKS